MSSPQTQQTPFVCPLHSLKYKQMTFSRQKGLYARIRENGRAVGCSGVWIIRIITENLSFFQYIASKGLSTIFTSYLFGEVESMTNNVVCRILELLDHYYFAANEWLTDPNFTRSMHHFLIRIYCFEQAMPYIDWLTLLWSLDFVRTAFPLVSSWLKVQRKC